jgi:hypothetical protein
MPPTFYALLKNFLRAATKQATESNTKRLQDKRNIESTIPAVGLQVDSEIDLSTRNGTPGCLSTVVILTLSNRVLINKTVINRDFLSTDNKKSLLRTRLRIREPLVVGKLGQGIYIVHNKKFI